jgi:hypothetical protein
VSKLSVILDTETYPNCFLLVACIVDTDIVFSFEISQYKDQSAELYRFLSMIREMRGRAYGFNIVGFDGPILHTFMRMGGKSDAMTLYRKAQAIIESQDDDKWVHSVKPSDRDFEWVDLYRINHFNNKARSTSLKMLEFNMRMSDIQDLPFKVGTQLTSDQVLTLKQYCLHDVKATELFRIACLEAILLREELTAKYQRDFMNFDDVKIGSTIFEIALEQSGVECYEYSAKGRSPKQTMRPAIALKDVILPWIEFKNPEFARILDWFKQQVITETKGVFDDVVARINGFEYVFGLGGIHGSVESKVIESSENLIIESWDVSSYYPNLSITNRFYPAHLGEKFCDVYQNLYEQRKTYPKGSAFNAAYKLALNGTYGKSNDKFSVFYDPAFTMSITINGQLLLCVLAEHLLDIPTVNIVMCNTDGLEYTVHPSHVEEAKAICLWWETYTGLQLENVRYKSMFIRDCNNYIAVYESGKVKRKGAYEYNLSWHQNAGGLVIPKVAEKVLVEGAPIRETVENWPELMDFMLRTKVPRSSYLQWGDEQVQNITRYYIAKGGKPLFKWMPPLAKKPNEWRKIGVESGWDVQVCNDLKDAVLPVNHDYYIQEIEKLTLGLS